MRALLATLERELRAYFYAPLAYVILTFFLIVNGVVFCLIVSFLNDPMAPFVQPFQLLFGGTFLFWLMILMVAPALTMRLLSEERRSGTIEVLMTAPISEMQVVVGKYLAALVFYLALWLPTLFYAVVLARHSELDWGPIASGYLGVALLGAYLLSIGTFVSAFTRNQVVAALGAFALLFLLLMPTFLGGLVNDPPFLVEALGYLDLLSQLEDFARGIVDTRPLVYYASASIFFLFLTARALEAKKWR